MASNTPSESSNDPLGANSNRWVTSQNIHLNIFNKLSTHKIYESSIQWWSSTLRWWTNCQLVVWKIPKYTTWVQGSVRRLAPLSSEASCEAPECETASRTGLFELTRTKAYHVSSSCSYSEIVLSIRNNRWAYGSKSGWFASFGQATPTKSGQKTDESSNS